ncbi:MAG: hypothetical protein V4604_10000 [Bacteroidota bacterium]
MKQLITLILLTITCTAAAQQETHVLNGKTYHVYPYQQEIDYSLRTFKFGVKQEEIIHRDSLNRSIVSTEVKEVKRFLKFPKGKEFRKYKKTFIALRRDYPGTLMNFRIPLEQDITPTLEPLPDGEYVQFYRDIPYVDKENILRYHNDQVAAVFSLKNNQLNGYACWLTTLGDTIKAGYFLDGLKTGKWFYNEFEFNTYFAGKPEVAKYLDGTYQDTNTMIVHYANGLLDGPYTNVIDGEIMETGNYTNGEASGEWYEYGYKVTHEGYKTVWTGEVIVKRHYFIPEKEMIGKSVIVRNQILDLSSIDRNEFEFENDNMNNFQAFSYAYHLYEQKEEEGLELPEEKMHSYPGEDYSEGMIYGDYGPSTISNLDFSYSRNDRMYLINDKYYTRSQLIDSIGYVFNYDKIYEEYHENGQLKMRYEIKNGSLVQEDTVFWDNGNPVSVINYLSETNQYEEKTFDYLNKLIYVNLYDSIGSFIKTVNQPAPKNRHRINNRIYTANLYESFFSYDNMDTLEVPLVNVETLTESLWRFDTTQATLTVFDPASRTMTTDYYALNKKLVDHSTATFSEDYESVVANEEYNIGDLSSRTLINGSYYHNPGRMYPGESLSDTVLNSRVKYWLRSYETTSDYTLYYKNQPFSGTFTINTHVKDFKLKTSSEGIVFNYATGKKHTKAVEKTFKAYKKKRKEKYLAQFMTPGTIYNSNVAQSFNYNVIPFAGFVYSPVDEGHFYENNNEYNYYDGKSKKLSEKKAESFDKVVNGQFLNGKPSGEWITKDQFGNITAKVPFTNGEVDGTVYYYATEYPEKESGYQPYEMQVNELLKDSFPSKPVYYLAKICHYKNGVLNGPFYEMTWLGDTITQWNYVDGHLEGPSLERTKIAFTKSNYEYGDVDGIMQTYLTLPGRDTTLLFDLNFQNGSLQGESKAYHLNGNLAKHGFFLSGQPIDDFEAFDTLGFKYQYVKFQYNQPIEEKIWEENQLSVRYEFDWKDSIYFNTRDIAGSTSLDRMLYQLGLVGNEYEEPYMGRPSLVDKTGIDYTMTKYYPNDTVARIGKISSGKKTGHWDFFSYEGRKLYEVNYFDSILQINDSVRFKSKGIMTLLDSTGRAICKSYIVEKIEKYDCSHTDHHEIRMLYTFWERNATEHRINGYVKNYYDNGVLMNEGTVKDGLATGVWKFYDPYGSLNLVGEYVLGKRNGRWLSGDLAQVKYMGDICLNPNLPNLDEIMGYQEKLLDISVIYYQMTAVKKREYYGVNMNAEGPPEGYFGEEGYYDEEMYYDGEYYDNEIRLR